jgi:choline kinase
LKAVILAAGSSTRLYPLTQDRPKCLLDIGGKTLLAHQLEALAQCQVRDVVIVVGYLADRMRQAINAVQLPLSVSVVHNPQYATTNNLYSLWSAREQLWETPFVCLHADVLFHPQILRQCLAAASDICLAVDREIHEETMKVAITAGTVTQIGKGIKPEAIAGTFLGIAKCSATAGKRVLQAAETLVAAGETMGYFTVAIERVIAQGTPVGFALTDGLPWIEIDVPVELERARQEIYPQIVRHGSAPG